MKWSHFQTVWHNDYDQDHHVTIIGPNGSGKTALAEKLVADRKHVVTFGVKYKDATLQGLINHGWRRIGAWSDLRSSDQRVVLWPRSGDLTKINAEQRQVFSAALNDIYKRGAWTVWVDEMRVLADPAMLGLRSPIIRMLVAGRSNNISMVSVTQRPSWVPQEAYSEAKHLILFKTNHVDDLKKIGSFNGISAKDVIEQVSRLDRYEFLHCNLLTGNMTTSKMEL